MSLPLSCEPTAIQFLSACRIPEKDLTTTNTEQPEPITYWLYFKIHQSNKKTVEIIKNATVIVSLFDRVFITFLSSLRPNTSKFAILLSVISSA